MFFVMKINYFSLFITFWTHNTEEEWLHSKWHTTLIRKTRQPALYRNMTLENVIAVESSVEADRATES